MEQPSEPLLPHLLSEEKTEKSPELPHSRNNILSVFKNNNNNNNGKDPKKQSIIIMITAAVLSLLCISYFTRAVSGATTVEIPYNKFIEMLDAGTVESV